MSDQPLDELSDEAPLPDPFDFDTDQVHTGRSKNLTIPLQEAAHVARDGFQRQHSPPSEGEATTAPSPTAIAGTFYESQRPPPLPTESHTRRDSDLVARGLGLVRLAEDLCTAARKSYAEATETFMRAIDSESDPKARELIRWYVQDCAARVEQVPKQQSVSMTPSPAVGFRVPLAPASTLSTDGDLSREKSRDGDTAVRVERAGTPRPQMRGNTPMPSIDRKRAFDLDQAQPVSAPVNAKAGRVDSVVSANVLKQGLTTYTPVSSVRLLTPDNRPRYFYSQFAEDTASRSFDIMNAKQAIENADTHDWMRIDFWSDKLDDLRNSRYKSRKKKMKRHKRFTSPQQSSETGGSGSSPDKEVSFAVPECLQQSVKFSAPAMERENKQSGRPWKRSELQHELPSTRKKLVLHGPRRASQDDGNHHMTAPRATTAEDSDSSSDSNSDSSDDSTSSSSSDDDDNDNPRPRKKPKLSPAPEPVHNFRIALDRGRRIEYQTGDWAFPDEDLQWRDARSLVGKRWTDQIALF